MVNHFDFEVKPTKSPMAHFFKKSLTMIFLIIVVVIGFSIFLGIREVGGVPNNLIKSIPLPDFATVHRAYVQALMEQEVNILLKQEEIDPLTDFINKYRNEGDKVKYVQVIEAERDQRCEQIKTLYLNRDKTTRNSMRLKKSYHYSCPYIVEDFATTKVAAPKP